MKAIIKIIDTITRNKTISKMHIEFLEAVEELKAKVTKAAHKKYDKTKYKFMKNCTWKKTKKGIRVKMELDVVEVGE